MWHRRRLAIFGGLFFLSACLDIGDTSANISPAWFQAAAPRSALLAEGTFRVVGPTGYCVDPGSVGGEGQNTAVLAACNSLANSVYAGPPVTPAVVLVSVSDGAQAVAGLDQAAQLAALNTPAGLTGLSGAGTAGIVEFVASDITDDSYVLHLSDAGLPATRGLAPDHARAVFDLNGRVVSVAAFGISGNRWNMTQSRRLVNQTMAALRAANIARPVVSELPPNN